MTPSVQASTSSMRRTLATSATQPTLASSAAAAWTSFSSARCVRKMTEQASLTPDLPSSTWLMSEIEMLCLAKMSTVSDSAHAVGDLQAHIVLGLELVHGLKGEVVAIGSISGSGATPRLICSESDRISPTTRSRWGRSLRPRRRTWSRPRRRLPRRRRSWRR